MRPWDSRHLHAHCAESIPLLLQVQSDRASRCGSRSGESVIPICCDTIVAIVLLKQGSRIWRTTTGLITEMAAASTAKIMKRVLLSWSSGKDSAWSLHVLRQTADYEIVGLLTTLNSQFDRVAMHGTRREILERQARAAELPLWNVPLPWPCSDEAYETQMRDACARALLEGVNAIAFGDLFLQDIRAYREAQLKPTGLTPLFPLWELPTAELAQDMIAGGL